MNIQFNIDWHGHLDISQYVREAEPKQRNADVRSAIYGRTDENNIELYLADCIDTAPSQTICYTLGDQDITRMLKSLHHIYSDDPVLSRQPRH